MTGPVTMTATERAFWASLVERAFREAHPLPGELADRPWLASTAKSELDAALYEAEGIKANALRDCDCRPEPDPADEINAAMDQAASEDAEAERLSANATARGDGTALGFEEGA